MTPSVRLRFGSRTYACQPSETVLEGWRVYLSGPAEFVEQLRRQTYLDGASIREIFFHAATD